MSRRSWAAHANERVRAAGRTCVSLRARRLLVVSHSACNERRDRRLLLHEGDAHRAGERARASSPTARCTHMAGRTFPTAGRRRMGTGSWAHGQLSAAVDRRSRRCRGRAATSCRWSWTGARAEVIDRIEVEILLTSSVRRGAGKRDGRRGLVRDAFYDSNWTPRARRGRAQHDGAVPPTDDRYLLRAGTACRYHRRHGGGATPPAGASSQ